MGKRKLDDRVNNEGTMPGNSLENPVASVAKLANAPIEIMP